MRGPLEVVAELLTGQADTAIVLVQPVPSTVVIVSGDGQTGDVVTALTDPIVVQVNGADGQGVQGVSVRFTTGDGGSFTPDSVMTDAQGQASTSWTLGATPGTQTATAAVIGQTGVEATITADAVQTIATDLAMVSGDAQTGTVGVELADSLVVLAMDALGNPVGGTTIDWIVTLNDGTVDPVQSVTDAAGLAATAWTMGTTVGANSVTAALPQPLASPDSASSAATASDSVGGDVAAPSAPDVMFGATGTPGPPALLTIESGDAQADTAAAVLALPLVVKVTDSFGNVLASENVAFAVTTGGGSVSVATVATDIAGLAQTVWTLGTGVGAQEVTVSSGALTPVLFSATASHAVPVQLAFGVGPSDTFLGDFFAPPLEVRIEDQYGNLDPTATDDVTLGIGTNPASGTLLGTTTVAAVAGVATFDDIKIDNIGAGYDLLALSEFYTTGTSATFDILVPPQRVAWITIGNGNWSVGSNWSTGTPPTALDTVLITQSGNYTVTLDVDATVEDIKIGGYGGAPTLLINGRTLTVNGTSLKVDPTGVLQLASGTLTGPGNVTVQGTLIWNGGTMSGTGTTTIDPIGTLDITGTSSRFLDTRTIDNGGTTMFTGTGLLYGMNAGTFNNLAGATFDATANSGFNF